MRKFLNKNVITFIILIVLSVAAFVFINHNDFLYKETIMEITDIKTKSTRVLTNTLGLEEKHYEQKVTGIITNGKDKGKKVTLNYEATYSSIVTEKYRTGDKVFISSNNIEGLKRDNSVVLMIEILLLTIFLVGKYRGILAALSVTLNTAIFYLGLSLYFDGINLLLLCLLESVVFTVISIIISSGRNKISLSAVLSVLLSLFILLAITLVVVWSTNYSGINFNEMNFLTVPIEDVLIAELMIGGLGAIMDVSITMSSSIAELVEKDKNISIKSLINSGKEIGKDIMGTMINVLFFTYLCSGLPLFVLAIRNGYTVQNYITSNFSIEITRFLLGSIGLVLAIPISLFIAIKILKRGVANE